MNVWVAKEAGARGHRLLSIEHLPAPDDPSHAGISGYEDGDLIVTIQDVHPAATAA